MGPLFLEFVSRNKITSADQLKCESDNHHSSKNPCMTKIYLSEIGVPDDGVSFVHICLVHFYSVILNDISKAVVFFLDIP